MGKIGDLWVKLGLRKSEFDSGMHDALSATKSFAERVKGLAPVAKVAWAAVAAAVVKFATDAVRMTQKWGDAWNVQMAGVKAAYGAFVRGIASGEGWNTLHDNIREAARLAKEAARALDEIFERKVSFDYQEAITERTIANLQLIMRDASKSDAERMAAAKEIIRLENELGAHKKKIAEDEARAIRDQFRAQTQMNDDEINFLVLNYNKNRDIIAQARNYLAERKRLSKVASSAEMAASSGDVDGVAEDLLNERASSARSAVAILDASTSQAIKDVAVMIQKYDKSSDDLVKRLGDAEVAIIRIDTDAARATTRATALLGSLTDTGNNDSKRDYESAQAIKKRAEDSAKSELQILSDKYATEKRQLERHGLDVTALTEEYVRNVTAAMVNGNDNDLGALSVKFGQAEAMLRQFGIDTTSLTAEYASAIGDIVANDIQDAIDNINDSVEPVDFVPLEIDDSYIEEFISQFIALQEEAEKRGEMFRRAVTEGFSAGMEEMMGQLFGLKEMNGGALIASLLSPLADVAIKQGEILIAQGIGVEACKAALTSLNGFAAIAAGTALIAIGAAAKSGLAALASTGGKSSSSSTYSQAGSDNAIHEQLLQTEMTIYVKGTIEGNNILLSGERTEKELSR